MTQHDDLQCPVQVIPENTRENPGISGFYPGFLAFSACWPLNNSNNSNNSNSMGWDEHLNNVEDFSQQ